MSTSSPIVCAIAGGSGSGKTTLATMITTRLGDDCDALAIDWYYRDLADIPMHERRQVNYDHPDSLEIDRYCRDLQVLRSGRPIDAPVYDFATHTRTAETRLVKPRPVIITEGILLFALDQALPLYDLRVFIDVDADLRLERRLARDVVERGRDPQDITRQWNEFVAPMHDEFVAPSLRHATHVLDAHDGLTDLEQAAETLVAELHTRMDASTGT